MVCLHLLYSSSLFLCSHISRKSCRYPCIGILRRGIFHLLLKFLVLIFRLFSQISLKYCHGSSQWLEGCFYHLVCLKLFQQWFGVLQVSSIVCESSFILRQLSSGLLVTVGEAPLPRYDVYVRPKELKTEGLKNECRLGRKILEEQKKDSDQKYHLTAPLN